MNFPPDEKITPMPWLAVKRTKPIKLIILHSTRGDIERERQYEATKNWLLSRNNNNGGWGSSTNRIISHLGQQCVAWPDEMQPTWSAGYGYGGAGSTWAIDEYAISFEMAQRTRNEPFTEETLARTAKEVAILCKKYNIPVVWLSSVRQNGVVPSGITGHENTDNGKVYGKTDPGVGYSFNPTDFIVRVKKELEAPAPVQPIENGGPMAIIHEPNSNRDYVMYGRRLEWIPNINIFNDLLRVVGQTGTIEVSKETFDWLVTQHKESGGSWGPK